MCPSLVHLRVVLANIPIIPVMQLLTDGDKLAINEGSLQVEVPANLVQNVTFAVQSRRHARCFCQSVDESGQPVCHVTIRCYASRGEPVIGRECLIHNELV